MADMDPRFAADMRAAQMLGGMIDHLQSFVTPMPRISAAEQEACERCGYNHRRCACEDYLDAEAEKVS